MALFDNVKVWAVDAGERAAKTFAQVFALQMIASGWFSMNGIVDFSVPKRCAFAAGGAALSVISSALSKAFGNGADASVVDLHPVDPAVDPAPGV